MVDVVTPVVSIPIATTEKEIKSETVDDDTPSEKTLEVNVEEKKGDLQRDLEIYRQRQLDLVKKRQAIATAMHGLQDQLEQRKQSFKESMVWTNPSAVPITELRPISIISQPSTVTAINDDTQSVTPTKDEEVDVEEILALAPANVREELGLQQQPLVPAPAKEETTSSTPPAAVPLENPALSQSMSSSNLSFPRLKLSTENLVIDSLVQPRAEEEEEDDAQTHTMTPSEDDVHSLTSGLSLNDDNWSDDDEDDETSFHDVRDGGVSDGDDFELLDVESLDGSPKEDENSQQLASSSSLRV
jgi:hypothetical protein